MLKSYLSLLLVFCLFACTAPKPEPKPDASKGTYFSINQFIKDPWDIYHGQPYAIQKTVYLNGKVDSTMTTAFDMEWGPILKAFIESDISDPKYLEKYDFSMFEDGTTDTHNFYYEAKDKKLFTRKLQISADAMTRKIRSIYIETQKNAKWDSKTQKLFYMPMKVLSIQEFEKGTLGSGKELRVEYRFL